MGKYWVVWGFVFAVVFATIAYFVIDGANEKYKPSFHHSDPAVRADAIRRLDWHDYDSRVLDSLHDEDADVRFLAAAQLRGDGAKATRRARALSLLLDDDQGYVRRQATESLASIGPDAWPVVRVAMNHDHVRVRLAAIRTLNMRHWEKGANGWPMQLSGEIAAVLAKLANEDPDETVRSYAKGTLENLARDARGQR